MDSLMRETDGVVNSDIVADLAIIAERRCLFSRVARRCV